MRFLVADGRKQAPVDSPNIAGLLKHLSITRQATFEVANEISRADIVEFLRVAVVAIVHSGQKAAAVRSNQKIVSAPQQTVARALWKCPRDRIVDLEIECDAEIGIEMPLNVELGTVRDGEVQVAECHPGQQVGDFGVGILDPLQCGINQLQRCEHVCMTTACHYLDTAADDVVDRAWFARAELVDEVHVDHLVRMAKIEVLTARVRDRQSCCGHVGAARQQPRHYFRNTVYRFDDEPHSKLVGERTHQIVLGTRGTVGAFHVRHRAVTCNNPQFTGVQYLLE